MEIVSNNFGIYINNIYNYTEVLRNITKYFNTVYNQVKYSKHISNDIKFKLSDYPKYPTHFKFVGSVGNFNIQKIREISLDNTQYLIDHINSNVLAYKTILDNIPTQSDSLLFDVSFQKTHIETAEDIYNHKKYFLTYYNFPDYDNLVYDMIGSVPSSSDMDNVDFIQQFIHLFYLTTNFQRFTNLKSQLLDFMMADNIFDYDNLTNYVTLFLDNKYQEIKDSTANIILKNVYSIVQTSERLLDITSKDLDEEIDSLKNYFYNFLKVNIQDPSRDLAILSYNSLIHMCATFILIKLCDQSKTSSERTLLTFTHPTYSGTEDSFIQGYLDKVNKNNIQSYLYLSYLYKSSGIKYINILPILLSNYTENIIFPDYNPGETIPDSTQVPIGISSGVSSIPSITSDTINGFLTQYAAYWINYDNYEQLLTENLTRENILSLWKKQKCSTFATTIYFLDLIDKFIASPQFTSFLESTLKNVFKTLRQNGFIDYKFDWFQCLEGLRVYYKSLFRTGLVNNELLTNAVSDIDKSFEILLTNSYKTITDELLDGRLNGKNMNFSTRYQFDEDSMKVFVDKTLIDPSEYTLFGTQHSIVFKTPPIGYDVWANYNTKYEIDLNFDSNVINSSMTSFCKNVSNASRINKFIKNFYLGTLTKQIIFDILNYFII